MFRCTAIFSFLVLWIRLADLDRPRLGDEQGFVEVGEGFSGVPAAACERDGAILGGCIEPSRQTW